LDDSSFYVSDRYGYNNFGYPDIGRYSITGNEVAQVAGGLIYAQSPDRKYLFSGPYNTNDPANSLVIADVSTNKTTLLSTWNDRITYEGGGTWLSAGSVGYFHFNDLNLIDFIITDLHGKKLDSVPTGSLSLSSYTSVYYTPGALFFSEYGLTKYDSVSRAFTKLDSLYHYATEASVDGTMIVTVVDASNYPRTALLYNAKTNASRSLGNTFSQHVAFSPQSDHVALVDGTNSLIEKLVVLPVSPP
jgi:hypothetical protein